MHARFTPSGPADAGRGIRGTFYPSDESAGVRSMGPALGKIAMVLIAIALVRNVIGRHGHGDGESRRSGAGA